MAKQIEIGFLRFWREFDRQFADDGVPTTCGEAHRAYVAVHRIQVQSLRDAMTTPPEPWQPGRINSNHYRKG